MKTTTKLENGKIKVEHTFEFTQKHKKALIDIVRDNFFEHRGHCSEIPIYYDLEAMGLIRDVEIAWHTLFVPTDTGKEIVKQLQ